MSAHLSPVTKLAAVPFQCGDLHLFSTSPQSLDSHPDKYLRDVADVARWSEEAGCLGTLVYTDNSIVDPWLVAQAILANTKRLVPLVAVQPLYMHPYAVAKMVASLAFLYGRRVILNMVAGGFKNDLVSLGDQTPHDRRYDRLIEYSRIIQLLTASPLPVTYQGEFYTLDKATLKPEVPAGLQPQFFVSGSSAAGLAAAEAIGGVPIKYPEPPDQSSLPVHPLVEASGGVRVGIIARQSSEEAWRVAEARFPFERKGQIAHKLAMRVSDSVWHQRLSSLSSESAAANTYWLGPFEISKSNCPYLVGSYSAVVADLLRYAQLGIRTFILDIPASAEELQHIRMVFEQIGTVTA